MAFEKSTTDSNGNVSWGDAPTKVLTALIRSVAFQPGPVGETTVPYCSTAAFTLNVATTDYFVNVPNEAITDYLWEVPAGWGVSGATLTSSLGNTPSDFRVYKGGRSITLTPTPGNDVGLRVFQYSGTCNQAYYASQPNRLISFPGWFRIKRQPTVAITSGPSAVYCGDRTPVTYTVQASQSLGNSAFAWSYPNGWTVQGAPTSANITLVPDGRTGGAVSVEALYTCTNPEKRTTSALVNVAVKQLPKPVITTPPALQPLANTGQFAALCDQVTISGTIVGTNANIRYVWTATGGMRVSEVNGTPVTSLTTANGSVSIYPGSGTGQGSIRVSAYNSAFAGCASSDSEPLNLVFGPPPSRGNTAFRIRGQRFNYAANGPSNGSLVCPGEQIYLSTAVPSTGIIRQTQWQVYRTDVQPAQLLQQQTNLGGNAKMAVNIGYQVGLTYEAHYQEQNDCGWGPDNICQLETINCDGGEEPFRMAPTGDGGALAAYPNPANNDLTVAQTGGTVRLYNSHGQCVRTQTTKPGRLHLDTSRLPVGLYFLELPNGQAKPQRQQIRIVH